MIEKYNIYSNRKLYTALNTTRATLSKLQSEKDRLNKKIESAIKKEVEIKKALAKLWKTKEEQMKPYNNIQKKTNSHKLIGIMKKDTQGEIVFIEDNNTLKERE
ncbi:hypothetical protein LS70_001095 [Helicobacter sp. MIT 11-5569]|uniref:hypothetical protein n=1 Tax=Helicobacter sp. MIT 11-5569 TaxID=1548151 RepID=UPI00051F8E9D|nr:hypothetical protein [Helicobacter sp. MIT 11-5569]TLD85176.1 hypothetical protein LS70_001095 [Helicobacter sp. MIT 11-5569]